MTTFILSATLVVLLGAKVRPRARTRTFDGTPAQRRLGLGRIGIATLPRLRRSRPDQMGPAHVASWCDDLARSVRSGATLSGALQSAVAPAPFRDHVDEITLALERGQSVEAALRLARDSSPDLNVALTVLRACATQGGSPAEPIDRAATTLRGRAADEANRRVQSAQARMSAVVITLLPVVMLSIMLVTSAAVRGVASSPVGVATIALGIGLDAAGWRWMNHLVEGRE